MIGDGREGPVLVDSSAAVALLTVDHHQHEAVFDQLHAVELGLSGHAAVETYSVLTRLPPPHRRPPTAIARLIADNFPRTVHLSPQGTAQLLSDAPRLGIAGGSIYDALVGATAAEHRLPLATLDRRATDVYRLLDLELIPLA